MKIVQRLNSELQRRQSINSRYSMRAYAKSLGLDVSMLSRILANKTPVTQKLLARIAVPLSLTPTEYHAFELEILQRKKNQVKTNPIEQAFHRLQTEEFEIIQDWYNFVILELTYLPNFQLDEHWIAKKLSISEDKAKAALERLLKLQLIIKNDKGQYVAATTHTSAIQDDFTTIAMRIRQKQVLQKAIDSIDLVEITERDQSAVTMAMDPALIPEVKEKIKSFRRSLANYIEKKSKNKERVYEISISLFPWDNNHDE